MVQETKKAEVTLSKFLIVLVIISLFSMAIFTLLISFDTEYEDASYRNVTNNVTSFQRLESIKQNMDQAKSNFTSLPSDNVFDVIGQVLKGGVNMVKGVFSSTTTAVEISGESIRQIKKTDTGEDAQGNTLWDIIEQSATTIILILILITIILAILTGRRT